MLSLEQLIVFALTFLGLVHLINNTYKISVQICICSLVVMVTAKMLLSVTMKTVTQGGKSLFIYIESEY